MIRSPLMTVMTDAVIKASRNLKRDFGEVENLQVSLKGPGDFVSQADRKAEKTIYEMLDKARPGYGFVMEESGVIEGSDKSHRWHIDPLDGTSNFLHGIPHFAISVGLEREGQMVAGVVLDVIKDEMFVAERGKGAYVNNRRLRVSGRRAMVQALFATGIPFAKVVRKTEFSITLAKLMPQVAGVRRFGSAALDLAWVAAGRYDGFWELGLNRWDIAAGLILVKEAGGFLSDPDGADPYLNGHVVAANPHLFAPLRDAVRQGMATAR